MLSDNQWYTYEKDEAKIASLCSTRVLLKHEEVHDKNQN